MKKMMIFFVALALSFSATQLHAQRYGARLGLTSANISFEMPAFDNIDVQNLTGMHFGLAGEFNLVGEMLRIVPELTYTKRGFKYTTTGDVEMGSTYNYLEIAARLKGKIPLVPVYAIAGPQYSYLLSGTTTDMDGNSVDIEFGDEYNRGELGMNVGLGVELGIGPIAAYAEARYGFAVNNFYEFETSNMKNTYWMFSLGVFFGN